MQFIWCVPVCTYNYWRAGASQPSRTSGSYITGAAHTVIPIQRQHAHKIATSESETVSLQKGRKRRHRRQSRDRAKRAVQSSQATKNCRGSETAEARERTDGDRRKRRLDSEKDTRYRSHYSSGQPADASHLTQRNVSLCL